MRIHLKILLLTGCIFLAFVKTAGTQIMVHNALLRAQVYVSTNNKSSMLDSASANSGQNQSDLKINLSAHTLGFINENTEVNLLAVIPLRFVIQFLGHALDISLPSIFRPPRAA